jgi:hypothetical protein
MMQTGFTHTISGNKIPPRQPPYVAQYAKPCTTGKQLAKAIAPMPVQTFRSNKVEICHG